MKTEQQAQVALVSIISSLNTVELVLIDFTVFFG